MTNRLRFFVLNVTMMTLNNTILQKLYNNWKTQTQKRKEKYPPPVLPPAKSAKTVFSNTASKYPDVANTWVRFFGKTS